MAYLSLYRKYRSQSFGELIGQEHVVRALKNGLTSGKISHAYLFTGPRGTGKTSTARLLAKCLCVENGPSADPDPEDENCKLIAESAHPDVIEMDAASESGVDDIRTAIVEAVNYVPMMSKFKVYIIDEVHDLSSKAFDALLKTIEEPPSHVVFVLATTEYQKVPPTIRSRCQKFEFHRGKISDISQRLNYVCQQENFQADPAAIDAIARMADGGFRDALSLLEQAIITAEGSLTLAQVEDQLGLVNEETVDELVTAIFGADSQKILKNLDVATSAGRDPRSILESIMFRLSDLSRVGYGVDDESGFDGPRHAALRDRANTLGLNRIIQLRAKVAEAHREIRDVTLPRIWLESIILGWANAQSDKSEKLSAVASLQPAKAVVTSAPTAGQKPAKAGEPKSKGLPSDVEPQAAQPSQPIDEKNEANPVEPETAAGDGDLEDGTIESIWRKLITTIEAPSHSVKLNNSKVVSFDAGTLTIELTMESYVTWYNADLRRIQYLEGLLAKNFDTIASLKLQVSGKQAKKQVPEAVELTLDGEALYNKAKSIFIPKT